MFEIDSVAKGGLPVVARGWVDRDPLDGTLAVRDVRVLFPDGVHDVPGVPEDDLDRVCEELLGCHCQLDGGGLSWGLPW